MNANRREWDISCMEAFHAKDVNGEIDRKMAGQENRVAFLGGREQEVDRGPFPSADTSSDVWRRK
jgi:hypothetical protein